MATCLRRLLCGVALLGLGVPACGGPSQDADQRFLGLRGGGLGDVLPSIREILARSDRMDARRANSRVLDVAFDRDAIPPTWHFLNLAGEPRVLNGRLQVPLAGQDMRGAVRWDVSFDSEDVTHLLVRIGRVPPGLARDELRLYWRTASQKGFEVDRRVMAPYADSRDGLMILALASHPRWKGRLEKLRLVLGLAGTLEIQSIRGVHIADFLTMDDMPPAAYRQMSAELGRTRRQALQVQPRSELREKVLVAPRQQLLASIGLHPLTGDLPTSRTRFEVSVSAEGVPSTTTAFVVPSAEIPLETGWHDITVDLSRYSAREAVITLRTAPVGVGETGIPLWSEPRIRTVGQVSQGPNLLLISVDTLRADHLESYGYAHTTSPTVSRLAAEGVRFAECVSHAPSTLPSHGSLFTGVPALKTRLSQNRELALPSHLKTLAETLLQRGFATAAFAGGAYFDPHFGLAQGFETYSYAKTENRTVSYDYSDIESNTEQALRWLEHNADRQFFLFFHTYEVHSPYDPRPSLVGEYLSAGVPAPRSSASMTTNVRFAPLEPPTYEGWEKYIYLPEGEPALTPSVLESVIASYDSEIRVTDAHISRILAALHQRKLLDRTVVVFTSDHGEAFLDHGRTGHGHLYAHNLEVPLVIRYPERLPAGRVIRERVQLIDVLPTCLDLLGIEVPDVVEGISLVPRVTADEVLPPRPLVSYGDVAGISYITPEGRKLIANLVAEHPMAGRTEIFDLAQDPDETDDLFGTLDPEALAELRHRVIVALEDLPGSHLVVSPERRARFVGTLALEGSRPTLRRKLRSFPLERGWVSFDSTGQIASIETVPFDQWWVHVDLDAGRLSLRGELIFEDGRAVPVDEVYALEAIPGRLVGGDARSLVEEDGGGPAAFRAFAVRHGSDTDGAGAPAGTAPSEETRRQLEELGYLR